MENSERDMSADPPQKQAASPTFTPMQQTFLRATFLRGPLVRLIAKLDQAEWENTQHERN